jgi:Pyruvate/2-oxoacid:ferredoxin oxidoreductase delta subunit
MVINKWLTGIWVQNKVKVNNKACKKCYNCVKVCPPKAMKVLQKKDFPWVDQDTCIQCYCCVEICPECAIEVKGFSTVLDRWRGQDKAKRTDKKSPEEHGTDSAHPHP